MRFEVLAMALRSEIRRSWRLAGCAAAATLAAMLAACDEGNGYVAPPPPKVTVALPLQQKVTRYLETTDYTAAIKTTKRVARGPDFLQQGRRAGEGRRNPVHHRARALPVEARAGTGRGWRHTGDREADRGGIRSAGGTLESSGRDQGRPRQCHRQS